MWAARRRDRVPATVRRTLELSCEAPIAQGFVSFNSLFDGLTIQANLVVDGSSAGPSPSAAAPSKSKDQQMLPLE